MNCAIHTEVPAVAYCRTCGKALCEECKRDVQGVIYCEPCIAARLADTMPPAAVPGAAPPPGAASPALAALLGFIPGVGAMYNGQFMKALMHVVIFVGIIWMTSHADFFGIFIPFWIFYMVFDAYATARARQMGRPLPDPFGFENMLSNTPYAPYVPPSASATGTGPTASRAPFAAGAAAAPAAPQAQESGTPIGAIVLIALGVLFLLNTMGWFRVYRLGEWWPLILIVIGLWLIFRRSAAGER